MATKSTRPKIVRKSAAEIPSASAADLKRLHSAMTGKVDTSEIGERRSFTRLARDSSGRLPVRKSVVRDAVTREMRRRQFTTYRVWKEARGHCPTLSQSAVHEFLKGKRELELPYAEALLRALGLTVARAKDRPRA